MQAEFQQDLLQQNILLNELNNKFKSKLKFIEEKHLLEQEYSQNTIQSKKQNFSKVGILSKPKPSGIFTVMVLSALILVAPIFLAYPSQKSNDSETFMSSKYLIENLRGDIQETWKSWRLAPDSALQITLTNSNILSDKQKQIVQEVILSEETIQVDNSILHKGLSGTTTTYYLGWKGALIHASEHVTKYVIPINFVIHESNLDNGDIIINFSTLQSPDGYSGYTKSIVEDNEILKSSITIYNIDKISNNDLETILRHEFGHALGLGHSSAPEDLMSSTITTVAPYISPCNIAGLILLYNGDYQREVTCSI